MAARARAVPFGLVALAFAGGALAQDNPPCAQYEEPMAYNACLARHGPKASDRATRPAHRPIDGSAQGRAESGEAERVTMSARRWLRATRDHGRVHMEFQLK